MKVRGFTHILQYYRNMSEQYKCQLSKCEQQQQIHAFSQISNKYFFLVPRYREVLALYEQTTKSRYLFAIQFHYISTEPYPKFNFMNTIYINHSMNKLLVHQADILGREQSYKSILAIRTQFRCFYAWRKCQIDESRANYFIYERNKRELARYFDLLYHDAYLYSKTTSLLRRSPSARVNGLLFLSYFQRYAISRDFDLKLKMLVKEVQEPID